MDEDSASPIPAPPEYPAPRPPDRRGVATILWQVLTAADAMPLDPPEVRANLAEMPPLLRLHACLRLFLLDIEYAISPGGQLRGLCKLACRISVALAFLTLCLAGVLACVVLALAIVVVITRQLVLILWNLLMAVLLLIALLALAAACLFAVRVLVRSSGRETGGVYVSGSHQPRRP